MAIEVKVPDIGDFTNIPVIEILVKVGDTVRAEDALVTLESDKATMEVPAPSAGVVKELKVKLGDKVSEGSIILILEAPIVPLLYKPMAAAKPPLAPFWNVRLRSAPPLLDPSIITHCAPLRVIWLQ